MDIQLAPSTKEWEERGLAGRHGRVYFHLESCRVLLEARHTIILGSAGGTEAFTKAETRVLESNHMISIGDCLYTFEYTEHVKSPSFSDKLTSFMKKHYGLQWSFHKLLSPASVGHTITFGSYTCSPGAFARGTFGQVTAGWTRDGTAVAVKRFINPKEKELKSHRELMTYIGLHVSYP